jgi:hypothetical protein
LVKLPVFVLSVHLLSVKLLFVLVEIHQTRKMVRKRRAMRRKPSHSSSG